EPHLFSAPGPDHGVRGKAGIRRFRVASSRAGAGRSVPGSQPRRQSGPGVPQERLPMNFTESATDGSVSDVIVTNRVTSEPVVAPVSTLTLAVMLNVLVGATSVVWYVPATTAAVMLVVPLKY